MCEITIATDQHGWEPGDIISVMPDNAAVLFGTQYDLTPPALGGHLRLRLPEVPIISLKHLYQPRRDVEGKVVQRRQWRLRLDLLAKWKVVTWPVTLLNEALDMKAGKSIDLFEEKEQK